MKVKRYLWIVVCLIALAISAWPVYAQQYLQPQTGFQISTLGALNAGVYQGAATLSELKQHGDFGLGTFEGLDGEMVLLKGKFYQIKADGKAYPVEDQVRTPFAAVTFFRRSRSLQLTGTMTYPQLLQQISDRLSSQNWPYAIRIQGTFAYLKVRSVPSQTLPYPPLSEVIQQQQRVFELRDVQGTLVGFRMPQYLKVVNVAGYHFHFVTRDRKAGGHLLEGEFLNPIAEVETLQDWQMLLPNHTAFEQAALE